MAHAPDLVRVFAGSNPAYVANQNKKDMENLGLFIYFAGVADSLIIVAGFAAFVCAAVAFIYLHSAHDSYGDEASAYFSLAKRWGIIAIACCMASTFIPSKRTCYEIFGVTAAAELYKNSESLQQLPEKSVEALNRLLDSIASDDDAE